jgi:hypothetical protein
MGRVRSIVAAIVIGLLAFVAYAPEVFAAQANSTNYGVNEVRFGSGGLLNACNGSQYCAKMSAGELTVGNSKVTAANQVQAGGETVRDPFLEVSVAGGTFDLGELDLATVKTASTTFSVKTYLASGYNVYLDGTSPRHPNGNILDTLATPTASSPGTEQFGVNLIDNSSPDIGADVVQVPSSTFSFGAPTTDYDNLNQFKYVAGDIIASSNSSSGQTNYTLSMIANISSNTSGGSYRGRLVVNVIPTF